MKRLVVAGACALALFTGGCLTAADSRVGQLADRISPHCTELQLATLVADAFAGDKLRVALAAGRATVEAYCTKPPRTVAELTIFIGEVVKARQAIDAAKRAA